MIEPGFPTLLAHPLLAFALAALALGVGAALLLRGGSGAGPRQPAYWLRLDLLAELLLALGLIGLLVFGGRLALASNQLLREQRLQLAQQRVDEGYRAVSAAECLPAPPPLAARKGAVPSAPPLTPFNPAVAARELCALAQARPGSGAAAVEWQVAAQALRDFGARYPGCVDNVFSRNNDCEATVAAASKLANAVDALGEAMQAARRRGADLLAVTGDGDGGFALLSALLAAAGMAIRIARAAARLRAA